MARGDDPETDGPITIASPAGRRGKSGARSGSSEPRTDGVASQLEPGEHVGRYVIREVMAEGGMGVVYLAHDPELDRELAIKLIRPGAESEALESGARLLREAQAMARLSHPNVVVIHDVGSVGGQVFLAMEYVRGKTLRRWLGVPGRTWRESLDAFIAAGRGLAAAHEVGIIHRDFKPDNVLVRLDGRVQVTDFGLARDAAAVEAEARRPKHAPERRSGPIPAGLLGLSVTVTGDLVGTPLYMAPEQHRREGTDARTDQFSFCVALFEALCGRHPFGAPASPEFLPRVLAGKSEAPAAHLPAPVRRALARGLAADPDGRFPAMAPLLAELERGRSHRRARLVGLGVAAAAVLAGVSVFAVTRGRAPAGLPVRHVLRTSPLTHDADLQLDPALSPDGKLMAYASGQLGHMRIYVRPISGGQPVDLTDALPGDHRWPQWSPDGSQIVFQAAEAGFESRYLIYRVPAGGGPVRKFIAPAGKSVAMPAWSPDGHSLAYIQFDQDWNPPWEIIVSNADGSAPRLVLELDNNVSISTPSWSPDSTRLAYSQGNAAFFLRGNIAPASIWDLAVGGGPPVQVTSGQALDHAPVWTRDGAGLLFVSDRDGTRDIYQIGIDDHGAPLGAPERITAGLNAHTVAIAGDGRLVCSVFTYRTNVWAVPIPTGDAEGSLADARPVTSGNQIVESVDPSADGKWLLFDSNPSGNQDVYVMPAAGGEPVALTSDPANDFAPSWSPDGQHIAFHSFRTGTRNIFTADRDGRNVVQITTGAFNNWNPRYSPDGRTLTFYSDRTGDWEVWTVPAAGGSPHQLTSQKAMSARWSPDGRSLTFTDQHGLWTMPADGGTPVLLVGGEQVKNHNWSHDGRTIYYRRQDREGGSMWAVPAAGGEPRRVLSLEDPARHPDRVEFGVDDHRFLLPLTEHDADLYLIELGPAQ